MKFNVKDFWGYFLNTFHLLVLYHTCDAPWSLLALHCIQESLLEGPYKDARDRTQISHVQSKHPTCYTITLALFYTLKPLKLVSWMMLLSICISRGLWLVKQTQGTDDSPAFHFDNLWLSTTEEVIQPFFSYLNWR